MDIHLYVLYESRDEWLKANRSKLEPELTNTLRIDKFLESDKDLTPVFLDISKAISSAKICSIEQKKLWFDQIIKDPKAIVWNITDGYEYFVGANIPAFCTVLKRSFIGSKSYVQMMCQNKHHLKSALSPYGINTAQWRVISEVNELKGWDVFPCFIKPASFDNSIGIGGSKLSSPICNNPDELKQNILSLIDDGIRNVLVEQFLPGNEYTVCCIHASDWKFECLGVYYDDDENFFSSTTKEKKDTYKKLEDQRISDKLISLSYKIIEKIGIEDYCRIDFREDASGNISFLEVNTAPFLNSRSFKFFANSHYAGSRADLFKDIIVHSYARKNTVETLKHLL